MKREGFSGRFGLIAAALGMAIGTGNLWRFPRIAAKYEGGAFLVPWVIFLLTWSIPILIAEFSLGKATRRGPIGAFSKLLGRQTAWMGAFMAFVTLMIATYYSVVAGWTLKYLWVSLSNGFGELTSAADPESLRANHEAALTRFQSFLDSDQPLLYHFAAVAAGVLVVWRGVRGGVELLCKIMIPALFLTLIAGAVWALSTIDGASAGLNYLFEPRWELLKKPDIWIDALSQSAWSTGAGWGLILAYGAYARRDEDSVTTNCTAAFGNNLASLLAAMFLFPAAFGLLGAAGMNQEEITAALANSGPGNTGFAFQYVPFIFKSIPEHGALVTSIFFGGLFVAALSSLIAMYEMGVKVLMDLGLGRTPAVLLLGLICAGVGVPSAIDMDFFVTMDWVWSIGLVVSGLMVVWAVQLYGIHPFRQRLVNPGANLKVRWGFNWAFLYLLPLQAVAMLGWWLYAAGTDPSYFGEGQDPWNPWVLGTYNVGAPVVWCAITIGVFILLSPWLGRRSLSGEEPADADADFEPQPPPFIGDSGPRELSKAPHVRQD